jgi:hypothetical protein
LLFIFPQEQEGEKRMIRSKDQWDLLRAPDPDAYALAVQMDEIGAPGGIPRIVYTKRAAKPALPAPPAPVVAAAEPQPASGIYLCREERQAIISAVVSTIKRYVAAEFEPILRRLETLEAQIPAGRSR